MLQPTFVYNWTPIWYEVDNFLRPGNVPGGTRSDLGRGLEETLTFFANSKSQGEADMIILFTDGGFSWEDEPGKTPEESATLAKARLEAQIQKLLKPGAPKLLIVALGADSPTTIPEYQRDQHDVLVRTGDLMLNGRPARTMYDGTVLKRIAARLGPERCQIFRIKRPEDFKINWPRVVGSERMNKGAAPAAGPIAALTILLMFLRVFFR